MASKWSEMYQTVAAERGDRDGLIVLERAKRPHMHDTRGIAPGKVRLARILETLDDKPAAQ